MLADTVYYARNIYEMAPAAASRPRSPARPVALPRPKVSCGLRWEWNGGTGGGGAEGEAADRQTDDAAQVLSRRLNSFLSLTS